MAHLYLHLSSHSGLSSPSTVAHRSLLETLSPCGRFGFLCLFACSLAAKIYGLIVYFSRMRLEVSLIFNRANATETLLSTVLIDFSFPEVSVGRIRVRVSH